MRILERYVLREHLLPFLLGFSVVTVIFVLDFLFDYLDLIVGKGIPALIVFKLFLLALGWITALSFPCGVLVASLMTFGRLAQDNEITAARACGLHLGRLILPVLGGATFLAVVLALFNNFILPDTNHRFANLSLAIHRKSPTASIHEGVFNNDFPDKSLLVERVNNRTGEMRNIVIYDFATGGAITTIIAREGHLEYSPDGTTLRLDLRNGMTQDLPADGDLRKLHSLEFTTHTILLRNADAALEIPPREQRGEREMDIGRLRREIGRLAASYEGKRARLQADLDSLGFPDYAAFARRALPPPTGLPGVAARVGAFFQGLAGSRKPEPPLFLPEADKQRLQMEALDVNTLGKRINAYTVEIHKKFSIPFACIVFVLLGAPMGMKARRGGMATSAISIVFFAVYYLLLIGGEQLADRRLLLPAVAMWAPNVVLGAPGIWLTWKALQGRERRN